MQYLVRVAGFEPACNQNTLSTVHQTEGIHPVGSDGGHAVNVDVLGLYTLCVVLQNVMKGYIRPPDVACQDVSCQEVISEYVDSASQSRHQVW